MRTPRAALTETPSDAPPSTSASTSRNARSRGAPSTWNLSLSSSSTADVVCSTTPRRRDLCACRNQCGSRSIRTCAPCSSSRRNGRTAILIPSGIRPARSASAARRRRRWILSIGIFTPAGPASMSSSMKCSVTVGFCGRSRRFRGARCAGMSPRVLGSGSGGLDGG